MVDLVGGGSLSGRVNTSLELVLSTQVVDDTTFELTSSGVYVQKIMKLDLGWWQVMIVLAVRISSPKRFVAKVSGFLLHK